MKRPSLPMRRILLPGLLAAVLAVETIAVAAAVETAPATTAPSVVDAGRSAARPELTLREQGVVGNPNHLPADFLPAPQHDRVGAAPTASRPAVALDQPAPKSIAKGSGSGAAGSSAKVSSRSHSGRNHMWMPALGIDRSVSFFSCSSSAYPGNRVYRWGCGGSNNVYLFGHAHSVFKPLHDAYVSGRLKKGMQVAYADGKGKVRTYRIAWWRVTTPDNGAFAYASQARPSMTLQTCVGKRSQFRLIVRLVQVG